MSTFYPGPWAATGHDELYQDIWTADGAHPVASCVHEANAHLIASAPELLAACEAALSVLRTAEALLGERYTYLPADQQINDQLRDAIAKAHGVTHDHRA